MAYKILLADDSATIRKVVELTFAEEGIAVYSVGDGDSAMKKFVEIEPDLVIADVNMPGVSGYRLCEMIKQDESSRHIPVILLVGSFEPFDPGEASRVGSNYYFTKPFTSIRELVEKVTEYLEFGGLRETLEPETADIEDLYLDSFESTIEIPNPETEAASFAVESAVVEPPRLDETQTYDSAEIVDADLPAAIVDEDSDVVTESGFRLVGLNDDLLEQDDEPAVKPTWEVLLEEDEAHQSRPTNLGEELGDPGIDDEIIETSHPGASIENVDIERSEVGVVDPSIITPLIDPFDAPIQSFADINVQIEEDEPLSAAEPTVDQSAVKTEATDHVEPEYLIHDTVQPLEESKEGSGISLTDGPFTKDETEEIEIGENVDPSGFGTLVDVSADSAEKEDDEAINAMLEIAGTEKHDTVRTPEPATSTVKFALDDIESAPSETVDDGSPVKHNRRATDREEQDRAELSVKGVSPDLIEAIVQSVLEKMSDRAVREVAREAVPRIAETLIREAIDEKKET